MRKMSMIRIKQHLFTAGLAALIVILLLFTTGAQKPKNSRAPKDPNAIRKPERKMTEQAKKKDEKVRLTEQQWRQKLTPEQYYVLREKGTERPFTGKYTTTFDNGLYKCAACGNELFTSDSKFESDCGWPAFSAIKDNKAIIKRRDTSHGMIRTEILCAKCGSHLGHVFDDGPAPTGLRYCINSVALDFEKEKSKGDPNAPAGQK